MTQIEAGLAVAAIGVAFIFSIIIAVLVRRSLDRQRPKSRSLARSHPGPDITAADVKRRHAETPCPTPDFDPSIPSSNRADRIMADLQKKWRRTKG